MPDTANSINEQLSRFLSYLRRVTVYDFEHIDPAVIYQLSWELRVVLSIRESYEPLPYNGSSAISPEET
jgi:hypothetical protein